MSTRIKCVEYVYPSQSEKKIGPWDPEYFFPEPTKRGEFVIDMPAKEVLSQILPAFRLKSYIDVKPWLVHCEKKGFVSIYECDCPATEKSIDNVLSSQNLVSAKRSSTLTIPQKEHLIEGLIYDLSLEHGPSPFRSEHHNLARAYADVLNVLGKPITYEAVSKMLAAQSEKLHQEKMKHIRRMNEDWSLLANQTVGAEIPNLEQKVLDD